jgi:hypothetical protein
LLPTLPASDAGAGSIGNSSSGTQLYGARKREELSVLPLTRFVRRRYRRPTMLYSRGIPALALVFMACLLASGPAGAEPAGSSRQSLLLLRNGNVLEGEVTQAGDYYVVLLGASEIRLPAREVEAQVASLEEAYQLKKFGLFGRGAEPHLKLAQWCLRHGLHAGCGQQLAEAARLEAEHPGIASIERRLAQALAATPASIAQAVRPASSVTVRSDDLEKAIRALPKASVERFAAVVQPLLLNRCGANQCHGANSKTEFHVLRPPGGQAATQRFTQRNLYAALEYIDRASPDDSPLVVMPAKQHGSSLVPVFDKQTQKQLDELKAWVKLTVGAAEPARPSVIPSTIPGEVSPLSQSGAAPGLGSPSTDPAGNTAAATPAGPPATDSQGTAAAGRNKESFVPRDPFDPEIFNRRYKK